MIENDSPSSGGPIPASVSMKGTGDFATKEFLVAKDPESRLDAWIDWVSDYCSSILVKETRQAIKSRQFFFTFMLLLAIVICWTFFALSPARDQYDVDSLGSFMLCGFLWILGLPLVLIVPYTTFRSLAQEYEDGTIDMVLITTMRPLQIIAGKLGSAMLQVLIYVSILSPCIAFCYLLRGVDISQIWLALCGALVVNFGLCCLAIALASSADSQRSIQVMSVFLILGLLAGAWLWCFFSYMICSQPIPAAQRGIVSLMIAGPALAWISSAIVLFLAASSKIAFKSSNRSTWLRVGITVQVVLFLGWMLGSCAAFGFHKFAFMFASVFAMQYLLLVGAMMVGCHAGLSPRVRRSLPDTALKQSLFSLYMPGPGRAYLFTVGLAFGLSAALSILVVGHSIFDVQFDIEAGPGFSTMNSFGTVDVEFSLWGILANLVYFLFFFNIVFLVSRLFAWRSSATRKPFVIEMGITAAALVFLAIMGSYAIAPDVFWNLREGFNFTQTFNWYRVQYLAVDRNNAEAASYLVIICFPTIVMFYMCLRFAAPELSIGSSLVPDRVREENEQMKRDRARGLDDDDETIDEIFAAVRPKSD